MKYVYVVRYVPSGLWICSRDNKNKITLSNFGSCKVFVNKPNVDEWFNVRYPIHIIDHPQSGIMSHKDFLVESILLTVSKEELLKPYFFLTYCAVIYLFKLPLIVSIAVHEGFIQLRDLIIAKYKELKKVKHLDRHSDAFFEDYLEHSRSRESTDDYYNRVYGRIG